MEKIDTSTNSKRIQEPYDKLVRGDPNVTYVVYTVDRNATLDVDETGSGSLDEFVENFTDGQVQFGLARVNVPGSDVSKIILLGWCPDNSPVKLRLSFANNFADVSRIFSGYHIQITARDQDDLDVDEFLNRVASAAGARYSTVGGGKASGGSTSRKSASPSISKPIVSKPVSSSTKKPEFVPKSTGKPITPVVSKSKSPAARDDGWGDAQDVEERDFDEKPLENVPSTYKPTKVNINELRKQKSDTVSSTPKTQKSANDSNNNQVNKGQKKQAGDDDDDEKVVTGKPLSERLKAYDHHDDGRLTSLPKPKVGHSVADRYKANAGQGKASFGAKPNFGSTPSSSKPKDKVVGGFSKDFGAENGKTPAQIWAEKRGKYKTVSSEDDSNDNDASSSTLNQADEHPSHASELAKKFEQQARLQDQEDDEEAEEEEDDDDDGDEDEKPARLPARSNIPPPPPAQSTNPDDEDEDEEEDEDEKPARLPPRRNLPPPISSQGFGQDDEEEEEEEDEEEEQPARLPARNLPPLPSRQVEPEPEEEEEEEEEDEQPPLPSRQAEPEPEDEEEEEEAETPASSAGATATAEYDYEKDEDNEIGFEEGDLIIEIDFVDEDWWSGKHQKTGEVGLFPANYVKLNQ